MEHRVAYNIIDILTRVTTKQGFQFVAIEIQCSAIKPEVILERMINNTRHKIATIWVLGNPAFRAYPELQPKRSKWLKLIEDIQGVLLFFDDDATLVPGFHVDGKFQLNSYKIDVSDLTYSYDSKYNILAGKFYPELFDDPLGPAP